MFAPTVALFTRSLRIDARLAQPHAVRLLFAMLILFSLMTAHAMSLIYGAPGLHVFTQITWLNFVLITLAGLSFFATAISEEKEEDSLGLLRMAGISPVALLLGKSTTRMMSVLLILAVEFPFVLLSITLGGVTMYQIVAVDVALVAYMVFMANLGMTCSVCCSSARWASSLMTILTIGIFLGLPILGSLVSELARLNAAKGAAGFSAFASMLNSFISATSITGRLSSILATGFSESAFTLQVGVHLLAAAGLFVFSWMTFEYFTRESHASTRLERVFVEPFRKTRRSEVRRAWQSALMWKDFHFLTGGKRGVIVRSILFPTLIIGFCMFGAYVDGTSKGVTREMVGGTAMVAMLIAGGLELGLFAARVFREEVKSQTLPVLIMLPSTTAQLAWSKMAAVIPALTPAVVYFVLGAMIYPEGFGEAVKDTLSSIVGWYVLIVIVGFFHLTAYLSLVVKWGALPLAIFAIYVYHMILMAIGMLMMFAISTGPSSEYAVVIPLILLAIVIIAVLEVQIQHRLETLAGR